MTFDFTISLPFILALVGFAIGGIMAWASIRSSVQSHALEIISLKTQLKIASERTEEIRSKSAKELADFKLAAAKEYATNSAIQQVEERVVAAIEKLGARFDKFVDAAASRRRTQG